MPVRRSAAVVLGLTATLAAALSGCGSSRGAYDATPLTGDDARSAAALDNDALLGVCTDPRTNTRLPDAQCDPCAGGLADGADRDRPEQCRSGVYRPSRHYPGMWMYAHRRYRMPAVGARLGTSTLKNTPGTGRAFFNGGFPAAGGQAKQSAPASGGGAASVPKAPGRPGSAVVRGGMGGSAKGSFGG